MIDYKHEAIKQWTQDPAGTGSSMKEVGTKEFFRETEDDRYQVYAPWLKKVVHFEDYRNKKVLEIGVGLGTDHLQFARNGAILSGIDLTPRNIELARQHLGFYNLTSDFRVADVESLPFPSENFDLVYSFGVLHHVPHIKEAITEIHRVLKPGGEAIISVYNRRSLLFLVRILFWDMIVRGGFLHKSLGKRLSEIERGGNDATPLVRLYTCGELKKLFLNFSQLNFTIRHFGKSFSEKKIDKFFKHPFIYRFTDWTSHYLGWYIIVKATK